MYVFGRTRAGRPGQSSTTVWTETRATAPISGGCAGAALAGPARLPEIDKAARPVTRSEITQAPRRACFMMPSRSCRYVRLFQVRRHAETAGWPVRDHVSVTGA